MYVFHLANNIIPVRRLLLMAAMNQCPSLGIPIASGQLALVYVRRHEFWQDTVASDHSRMKSVEVGKLPRDVIWKMPLFVLKMGSRYQVFAL